MKITFFLSFCILGFLPFKSFSQVPDQINYQAIARDNQGKIMENKQVSMRFTILVDNLSLLAVYKETHQVMTNKFGLVNLTIGSGIAELGDFSLIDWTAGSYSLRVEIDVNGGSNFVEVSTSSLLTVPFAFHARTVEFDSVEDADSDPANEIQSLTKVGEVVTLSHGGGSFTDEVNDGDYDSNNELQFLYMNGDTIFLHSGGFVVLPPETSDWRIDGNDDIIDSVHFMGTTGDVPLRFRTNNKWAGELNPVSGNISLGDSANYQSGGVQNVVIGNRALFSNTDRSNLVAIGDSALYHNGIDATQGNHAYANLAVGSKSLFSNTTGRYNQGIGAMALYSNTTGFDNLGMGFKALYSNISGQGNLAFGYTTMYSNTTGILNIALGNYALYNNTEGYGNLAAGYFSLYWNSTGVFNSAAGYLSLMNNSTGFGNSSYGSFALRNNTVGTGNTALGYSASNNSTTGNYNTVLGYGALLQNTSGSYNTAIGTFALSSGTTFGNSTAVGYGSNVSASNQVRIGNNGVTSIGGYANWSNVSDGRLKMLVKEDVPGLDFIKLLRPVTYNLDMEAIAAINNIPDSIRLPEYEKQAGMMRRTGFIAQEVQAAAGLLGFDFSGIDSPKNQADFYGLRYAEFVVPLVKAMQEQQQLIENQQEQINQLLEMIEMLRQDIQALKSE